MTRARLPGSWSRNGGARIDTTSEMDNVIPLHPDRPFPAPPPLPDDVRSRIRRRAWYWAVAAFSLLAALLGISDPHFRP